MIFAALIIEYPDRLREKYVYEEYETYEDLVYFHKKEDAAKYLTDRMESDSLKALNANWGQMSTLKKARKQGLEDTMVYRYISNEPNLKQKLKNEGLYKYLTITKNSDNHLQHELKECYKGDARVMKKLVDCILAGENVECLFEYKIKEIEVR